MFVTRISRVGEVLRLFNGFLEGTKQPFAKHGTTQRHPSHFQKVLVVHSLDCVMDGKIKNNRQIHVTRLTQRYDFFFFFLGITSRHHKHQPSTRQFRLNYCLFASFVVSLMGCTFVRAFFAVRSYFLDAFFSSNKVIQHFDTNCSTTAHTLHTYIFFARKLSFSERHLFLYEYQKTIPEL